MTDGSDTILLVSCPEPCQYRITGLNRYSNHRSTLLKKTVSVSDGMVVRNLQEKY